MSSADGMGARARARKEFPIVDNNSGSLNVDRLGYEQALYATDFFQSVVNMRWAGFMCMFLTLYAVYVAAFGGAYYQLASQPGPKAASCISGMASYSDAVWFTIVTQMTLGYGGVGMSMLPKATCSSLNLFLIFHLLCTLLLNYTLLGMLYARVARPLNRTATIVFSDVVPVFGLRGHARLQFRIANMRKKQIINARVRLLMCYNQKFSTTVGRNHFPTGTSQNIMFRELKLAGGTELFLGLPAQPTHIIDETSPLRGMSIADLQDMDVELLVLVDGKDASTSSSVQASHCYLPSDMRMDCKLAPIVRRTSLGMRRVDMGRLSEVMRCGHGRDEHELGDDLQDSSALEWESMQPEPASLQTPAGTCRDGLSKRRTTGHAILNAKVNSLEKQASTLSVAVERCLAGTTN